MGIQSEPPAGEAASSPQARRDSLGEFRRLTAALARSARRAGSRDPEGAAQEALKRSLKNGSAAVALNYYFAEELPSEIVAPEWPLDQLLAWLHAVLYYVVREEHSRAAYKRETPLGAASALQPDSIEPPDPAADPLEMLMQRELRHIIDECFATLDREHRSVLTLRAHGMKYKDIAARLGVNENTAATWISRGIRALGRCVRGRMNSRPARPA